MARFIHHYQTNSEFTSAYNGTGYTEPWVSLTVQNGDVNYNKLMPIGYIDKYYLFGDSQLFQLGFDYNNDNAFNNNDFDYDQYDCPEFITTDRYSVSDIDTYVQDLEAYNTSTGEELAVGDDGWTLPCQIVRLANTNGQERWCMLNIAQALFNGYYGTVLDYVAVYAEKPELGNIAGFQPQA